jgi:hypothetical protein
MKKYTALTLVCIVVVAICVGCVDTGATGNHVTDDIVKQYNPWGLKYNPSASKHINPEFADVYYDYISGVLRQYIDMVTTAWGAPHLNTSLEFSTSDLVNQMRDIVGENQNSLEHDIFLQVVEYENTMYEYEKMIDKCVDNRIATKRNMPIKYPGIDEDVVAQQYQEGKEILINMLEKYFIME